MLNLDDAIDDLPLLAILRGVRPEEVVAVGNALLGGGFRILEVPLNSPDPIASIAALSAAFGGHAVIGAGTVLSPRQVAEVAGAGGQLIVMPHSDVAVIEAAMEAGLACVPGVATPTEAFAALAAGATALKLFPAEGLPPAVLKAWSAVLPPGTRLFPVGGINTDNMAAYRAAGAAADLVGRQSRLVERRTDAEPGRARDFVAAWRACRDV